MEGVGSFIPDLAAVLSAVLGGKTKTIVGAGQTLADVGANETALGRAQAGEEEVAVVLVAHDASLPSKQVLGEEDLVGNGSDGGDEGSGDDLL